MDGSRTEGGQQGTGSGQVVQLQREWFGPIADLIPIGLPEEPAPVDAPPPPVSAADFWGGDADLLQAVVERAEGEVAVTAAEPTAPLVRVAAPSSTRSWSPRSLAGAAAAAVLIVIGVFLLHAGPTSPGVLRHQVLSAAVITGSREHHVVKRSLPPARKASRARTSATRTPKDVVSSPPASDYTPVSVVSESVPPPP